IDIIQSHGYTAEEHVAHTDDGYLLTLHRIPPRATERRGVVFLQHGLLCSSVDWIVCGPARGLPYMLAEEGFDVWLGNSRGNSFSRQHVSLDPKMEAFWQFSWHEVGIYDLPAMIDYALNTTGHESLHYIGYSQGSTAFFVMASMRDVYNEKISLCQALAPVAFLSDSKSLFLKALAPFANQFKSIFNLLGQYEFLRNRKFMEQREELYDKSQIETLWHNVLFKIIEKCCEQNDPVLLAKIIENTPAGASINQLVHYAQIINTGKFSHFDFEMQGNLIKYGTKRPPEYPLHRIKIPTIFHIADNDIFSSVSDVEKLTKNLPHHVQNIRVPFPKFNHLDFLFATNARALVYETVVDVLNKNLETMSGCSVVKIVIFALLCVQLSHGDSIFGFWSRIMPGEGSSTESSAESSKSSKENLEMFSSPLGPLEAISAESVDQISEISKIWNPLSWFQSTEPEQKLPFNLDSELGTAEIIRRHGYPSEAHTIQTEDGYLLTVHRIPCARSGWTSCLAQGRGRGKAVFVQHGLLGSSADWVLSGPENGLAFLLADVGYDVWIGNARGNTYSNRHITLRKDDSKFWDFSWHEMAKYDIPAAIDYVLEVKNTENKRYSSNDTVMQIHTDILYVGHSMGTTMAFAMLAMRPEYNSKVKAMFALAPVAFMAHVKSPLRLIAPFSKDLAFLAKYACEMNDVERYICENSIFVLCGFDRAQYNADLTPVIFAHAPAGASTKTLVHYAQEIHEKGDFKYFDYGRSENEKRYGQHSPPRYNLTNISTPVALIYATNDWLAGPQDVELLHKRLPNSIGMFKVPFETFNHLDFMWGLDVKRLVYIDMLKLMEKYRTT
uniref:Putative triglyceride lipase-cholesterol esterase n=1 Tax=Lutzomyia longipalpis TaxID=7200 RepID=A0A1B0CJ10_LUTLO